LAEVARDRDLFAEKEKTGRERIIALENNLNSTRAKVAGLAVDVALRDAESGWLAQVAGYHLGYAGDPREVEERDAEALARWLSKRLSRDITIPDLSDAGMTFVGGRLFFVNGEPVGQIGYHDRAGRLTGFCIRPNPSKTAAPLTRQQYDDALEMISWQDQSYQYVLVGFEDVDVLQPIAERLATSYGKDI